MAELLLLLASKVIDSVEQTVSDLYVYVYVQGRSNKNCDCAAGMVQTLAEAIGKQKLSGCEWQRHFCFAEALWLHFR